MLPLRYYFATLTLALAVAGLDISGVQANPSGAYESATEEPQLPPCGSPYEVTPEKCDADGWSTAILGGDMAYCVKGLACGGTNPTGRSCPGPQQSLPYGSDCVLSNGSGSVKAGLYTCVARTTCPVKAEATPAPTTATPVTPAPTTVAPVTPAPTTLAPTFEESQQQEKTPEPMPCATLPYNYGPQSPTPTSTPCESLPYNYSPSSPTPAPATTAPAPATTAPAPATTAPAPATTAPGPTVGSSGNGSPSPTQKMEAGKTSDYTNQTEDLKVKDAATPAPTVPQNDTPQTTPCVYPVKSESPAPATSTPTPTPCVELTLKPDLTPAPMTPAATPCEDKFQLKSDAPTPAPTPCEDLSLKKDATNSAPTPAPTTAAPVTPAPTTTAPVTPAPTTTATPVTPAPTTAEPKTPAPTTAAPVDKNNDFVVETGNSNVSIDSLPNFDSVLPNRNLRAH